MGLMVRVLSTSGSLPRLNSFVLSLPDDTQRPFRYSQSLTQSRLTISWRSSFTFYPEICPENANKGVLQESELNVQVARCWECPSQSMPFACTRIT